MVHDSEWRHVLAGRMADRSPILIEELVEILDARLRAINVADLDAQILRASIGDNVAILLHLIDNPLDLASTAPPVRARALVRRLAQHGVPLYDILDAYYLSEKHWVQACMEELHALRIPAGEEWSAIVAIWDDSHDYVEHVCRLIAWEHEVERGKVRHGGDFQRARVVTELLDGSSEHTADAESLLGYPLRNRQLACVLWSAGSDSLDDAARLDSQFDRAVALLTAATKSFGAPLVIYRDEATRWVWLPTPQTQLTELDELEQTLARECPLISVAIGEPADDHAGFADSHRQARIAHEIGLIATPPHRLVPYRTVASLMFLVADLSRARIWVRETLGPLAVDGPRERELRATVALYLKHNRSISAAAADLRCHKNTVHYRIGVAESALGYRVAERSHDLATSLLACEWLGGSVLLEPATHE